MGEGRGGVGVVREECRITETVCYACVIYKHVLCAAQRLAQHHCCSILESTISSNESVMFC